MRKPQKARQGAELEERKRERADGRETVQNGSTIGDGCTMCHCLSRRAQTADWALS